MEQEQMDATVNKGKKETMEWMDTIVTAIVLVVLVFTFFFRMVGISGDSMQQTLQSGDRVILSTAFYEPEQGDVVVISRDYMKDENGASPDPIIKRIIATEGQTVEIDTVNKTVKVDGVLLDESKYVPNESFWLPMEIENPHTVAEGCVFVLGDHRSVSHDSRAIGDVDERYILGKAVVRIMPITEFKVIE